MENSKSEKELEKLFDTSNYKTLIVGNEKSKTEKKVNLKQLLKLLKSEDRGEKEIVLDLIKKEQAQFALMEGLLNPDFLNEDKAILIAACWESGLDFSIYINDFINLAIETEDLRIALECYTLIQESELKISDEDLDQAIQALGEEIAQKNDKMVLLSDLKKHFMDIKLLRPKENLDQ